MQKQTDNVLHKTFSGCGKLRREGNLVLGTDDTYDIGLVYLYCSFDDFREMAGKVFSPEMIPEVAASAYCVFGRTEKSGFTMTVGLVWINNANEKQLTIPLMVHELSHLVDDMLNHAGVKDSEGEAKAYLMEREARRLLKKFYHMRSTKRVTTNDLIEFLTSR